MRSEEEKEFAQLSWRMIEWRLAYYYPDLLKSEYLTEFTIEDLEYDRHEQRYLELCRLTGSANYHVHKNCPADIEDRSVMEIDLERPSVKLVLSKIGLNEGSN